MNEEVKYTLKLDGVDRLEKGLDSAKHHADSLESSMGHLKNAVIGLIGAYVGFETLKDSLHEFQEHKIAVAELTQMYNNNRDSVGLTLDQLDELAERTESLTGVESEHVMQAEQVLMKYKDIKVSYEDLIPLSADLAKGLGTDIAGAADMLGKALENPERAARMLMQTGASPDQAKMYQQLAATGDAAKAQAYLIDVLGDKYKGLAETAFAADTSAQLAIGFKQVQESIGELIEQGLVAIMPYIKATFDAIKSFVGWIGDHMGLVKTLGTIILSVAGAFAVYNMTLKAVASWEAITTAYMAAKNVVMVIAEAYTLALAEGMGVLEAVQWALNFAMEANPIGIIVVGLAALTAGVIYAYNHFETFRRVMWAVWSVMKDLFSIILDVGKVLFYLTTAQFGKMIDAAKDVAKTVGSIGTNAAAAYNAQESVTSADKKVGEGSKSVKAGKGLGDMTATSQADKVSGTKQVVINVTIGKLVEAVNVKAQNLKEGINQAAPDVAKALLSAVNQFSASTDI